MNYSRFPLPDLEAWQNVAETFRSRLASLHPTHGWNDCIDQKFMMVQAIRSDLRRGSRYQSASVEDMLGDLARDLEGLWSDLGLKFHPSSFGTSTGRRFYETDFLGIWCLILELATTTGRGSTIELSLGQFPEGMELEIGSDSPMLEQAGILESQAFRFVQDLLPVSRAVDLKCPLGGRAIQLDLYREADLDLRAA